MEQYFTRKPGSERIDRKFAVTLGGYEFTFTASSGVFAKNHLDPGTELLINTVINAEKSISGSALDLGCGYGPVGVVIAALNPGAKVMMADINERAVELAASNATDNKTRNAVAVQSDGFETVEDSFDIVITNPPIRSGKQNVTRLISDARSHMLPGARFYAVIGKKQGAASYERIIEGIFGNCALLAKKSGFFVYCSYK